MDDFFNNIVSICPNEFLFSLNNFNCLLRGRKKEWKFRDDLLPPSIECALQNNIINRWNPPNKRYLYLAIGNCGIDHGEKVCFEEMRIREGDIVTIANFDINKLAFNKKIINLDFDNISRQDIFDFMNATEKAQTRDLIEEIYVQKIVPTKENIKKQLESHTKETTALACSFCGKLLLKEICDTIFVPLDSTENGDPNVKDQCYKSFHILAEYFESKGIAGIAYPSTRMRLINQTGSNLVLFSVDDATPNLNTFRTIQKQ